MGEIFRELFIRKYGYIKHAEELSEKKGNFLKLIYLSIIFSVLTNKYQSVNELMSNYPYLEKEKKIRIFLELLKYNLSNAVNYFNDNSNIQEIQKEILNFKSLLRDMIKAYMFNYCLTVKLNSMNINDHTIFSGLKIGDKKLCRVNISNKSDFIFGNVELNLFIIPNKRVSVIVLKKPDRRELGKELEWEFELTGRSVGRVSIIFQSVIKNPFEENKVFIYKKRVGKLAVN